MGRNTVGIYLKTIKLLFLAFQTPPFCPYRCHPVTHFPSCPLSIPKISSPPPPCSHPCWLSHRPCCCAATSSHSLNVPPPSCDMPPPVVHSSSRLPLVHRLVVMLHLLAPPPPQITFCRASASCVHPLPPPSFTPHGCCIASHHAASASHPIVNTATSRCATASRC
jgi:hypothetical protein